ncbi:hypothetical protein ACJJTC_017558 [Scirpophaga incertulas]
MDDAQAEMAERMYKILPAAKRSAAEACMLPHKQPFEVLYRLNCDNLCADFHEDLTFRFSYGITALIQRFHGKGSRLALRNPAQYTPIPPSISNPSLPSMDVVRSSGANGFGLSTEDWSTVSKLALGVLTSQGTMGGLLLSGLVSKHNVRQMIIVQTG